MNLQKQKPNDVTYNKNPELLEKVNKANPVLDNGMLKLYYYYLTERHSIYKKKLAGLPKPWTDNVIMQSNSFTNDHRYLDKTSKWYINNIVDNSSLTYSDKVWRAIIFRLYNKIETAELIELSNPDFFSFRYMKTSIDSINAYPNDPFSRAYKIIGIKYAYRNDPTYISGYDVWKGSLLNHIYNLYILNHGMVPMELESSGESCIRWLKDNIKGCGDFIAYQIFVDLTYIDEFPLSDNWTVLAGPGCKAGINMLCADRSGLSYEEFLYWMRDNIDRLFISIDSAYDVHKLFEDLPEEWQYWSLQSIENSFCEFSKLNYLMHNKHKNPKKYNGV